MNCISTHHPIKFLTGNAVLLKTLVTILILSSAFAGYSQKWGKLTVKGILIDVNGKPLNDVVVNLKQGLEVVESDTSKGGRFSIDVSYNKKYDLYFEKAGFATTFIGVDANIDSSRIKRNYTYILQYAMIADDSSTSQLNLSNLSSKPFSVVKYSYVERKFVEDQNSTSNFIADAFEPEGITIKGMVLNEKGLAARNVLVRVFDNFTNFRDTLRTDSTGAFEYKVAHNNKAKFEIENPNYYPVFMNVDATISQDYQNTEFKFDQKIKLLPLSESNINPSAFKLPITYIKFDSDKEGFEGKPASDKFQATLMAPLSYPLKVDGKINGDSGKAIANTKVILYDTRTQEVINVAYTDAKGNYILNSPDNSGLDLRFEKEGFTPTFVELDTKIPDTSASVKEVEIPALQLLSANAASVSPDLKDKPLFEMKYDKQKRKIAVDSTNYLLAQERIKKAQDSLAIIAARDTFDYENYAFNNLYLDGIISDEQGQPMSGVKVQLYHENGKLLTTETTDRSGAYQLKAPYNQKTKVYYERKKYKSYHFEVNGKIGADSNLLNKPVKVEVPEFPMLSFAYMEKQKLNPDAFEKPVTEIYFNGKRFQENAEMITALQQEIRTPFKPKTIEISGTLASFDKKYLEKTIMLLTENGTPKDTIQIDRKGNYTAKLEYNKLYFLELISPNYHPTKFKINTTTELTTLERENKKFSMPDMTLVSKDNLPIEASLFSNPVKSIYIDPMTDALRADKQASEQFEQALNEAMEEAKIYASVIAISGKVRGEDEKRIPNVKVKLVAGTEVIDSTITDRRGEYNFNLKFSKQYRLVFENSNYYTQFVAFNSAAPKELIANTSYSLPEIQLFEKDTLYDKNAFKQPYSTVVYNAQKQAWIFDNKQVEEFEAAVIAPKLAYEAKMALIKKQEDSTLLAQQKFDTTEVQLDTKEVKEKKKKKVEKVEEVADVLAENSEYQKQKVENQVEKTDLHLGLALNHNGRNELNNVKINLAETSIQSLNVGKVETKALNIRERSENQISNEEVLLKQEQAELLTSIANLTILEYRRRNVTKISADSVFSLPTFVDVKSLSYGQGVKVTEVHKVLYNGQFLEFVEVVNWFAFSSYYKNGESISEETFYSELNEYLKLNNQKEI